MIKLIDWIGRYTTIRDVAIWLLDKSAQLADAEQARLKREIDRLMAAGFTRKKAEATVLWENNLISTDGYMSILSMEK